MIKKIEYFSDKITIIYNQILTLTRTQISIKMCGNNQVLQLITGLGISSVLSFVTIQSIAPVMEFMKTNVKPFVEKIGMTPMNLLYSVRDYSIMFGITCGVMALMEKKIKNY